MSPGPHDPYWLRAHKDWRFLAVLFLMLLAMGTYLYTLDLTWWPHHQAALVVPPVTMSR